MKQTENAGKSVSQASSVEGEMGHIAGWGFFVGSGEREKYKLVFSRGADEGGGGLQMCQRKIFQPEV